MIRDRQVESILQELTRFLKTLQGAEVELWSLRENGFSKNLTLSGDAEPSQLEHFIAFAGGILNNHWIVTSQEHNYQYSSDFYSAINPALTDAGKNNANEVILVSYGGPLLEDHNCLQPPKVLPYKLRFIELGMETSLTQCANVLKEMALRSGGAYINAVSNLRNLKISGRHILPAKERVTRIDVSFCTLSQSAVT